MSTTSLPGLVLRSRQGRAVLAATILGSGMAQLDGTVVNVALPRIGTNLGAGLTGLQWTLNAYTLTLSGLLLLGGSLGDRLGRRRIFNVGVVWFAAASVACAAAPNVGALVATRAAQGVGAALLTPGSLAILEAVFREDDRAAAVGAWSGLGGVATAIGPVLGGVLVGAAPWGWRLIFLLNVPLAIAVIALSRRSVPETRDDTNHGSVDVAGVVLGAVGLALVILALTEGPARRWPSSTIVTGVVGVGALVAFVVVEARHRDPMLPLNLFRSRQFAACNLVTLVVYAALAGALFLLPVQLQRVSGFSPVGAGTSLLPVTIVMLLLSARMGRLAQRIGPRWPMTVGPMVAGAGLLLLTRLNAASTYVNGVLPAMVVFALGLSATVAPLTATVLRSAPPERVGIASAVNNDIARTAGLLAVAVLPPLAGITQRAYDAAALLQSGFHRAVTISGSLCILGGMISAVLIRAEALTSPVDATVVDTSEPAAAEHYRCPILTPNPHS